MKTSTLRNGLLALGIALVSWQPVWARCGELCNGSTCDPVSNPAWGCIPSGFSCWDLSCGFLTSVDEELMAKIEKAALAGDMNTVSLLAAGFGQPFRLHTNGKLVHDGFALAGLTGPLMAAGERMAACRSVAPASAEAPTEAATE